MLNNMHAPTASKASATVRASTSIFIEKPATPRACCTARVMLPALHTWLSVYGGHICAWF